MHVPMVEIFSVRASVIHNLAIQLCIIFNVKRYTVEYQKV